MKNFKNAMTKTKIMQGQKIQLYCSHTTTLYLNYVLLLLFPFNALLLTTKPIWHPKKEGYVHPRRILDLRSGAITM